MTEATIDPVDDVVDTDIDTNDDSYDELTVDDYKAEKSRREKAEKTLVEQKRRIKELEAKSSAPAWTLTEADLDLRDFIKANAELAEYRDDLKKYQSMGISLEKAKILIEADDKTIANRQKASKANITSWEAGTEKSSYNMKDLEKLSDSEYDSVMARVKQGKASIQK